ncbi:MAG: hypothetical protein OGM09_11635 [Fusobacterium varium]|uniref:beta strand repeat-containing protein n=1 Tax=Fusobacterium varium TaxID=856 RepID=UPI002431E5EB|nr:hypothetical protein [Fusobacterium varium]UYI77807.1 MAG: hypothetical protein OGM09_11635 [Fusobacterium varium]
MIEKIMKAVKSSNKRRGRNITIGAVVGFLLSCTAVMGANDNYLWIKGDSGKIQFNKAATVDDDGSWNDGNPYSDNNWDTGTKTYTNNIELSSNGANGVSDNGYNDYDISYGLRLSGELTDVNFINNSSIKGEISGSTYNYGYGIYNESIKMGNIENTGKISGTGDTFGYGIFNSAKMRKIENKNTGTISGVGGSSSGKGYGIANNSGTIEEIINAGTISGTGANSGSTGSGIDNRGTIRDITNTGEISGTGSGKNKNSGVGYGIYNSSFIEGKITNAGVISGTGKSEGSGRGAGYGIDNRGTIKEITNTGEISGAGSSSSGDGDGEGYGIYNMSEANEIGKIINTGIISGTGKSDGSGDGEGYGIYNYGSASKSTIKDITNAGLISGTGSSTSGTGTGSGIYNHSAKIENITNMGVMSGSGNSAGYGIYNIKDMYESTIGNIKNTGVISGTGNSTDGTGTGSGIYNDSSEIGKITNTGLIIGNGNSTSDAGTSYGIYNDSDGKEMGAITNTGIISGYGTSSSGKGDGYGIYNKSGTIGDITNAGLINVYAASTSTAFASGIFTDSNATKIGNITNTGVISGYGNGLDSGSVSEQSIAFAFGINNGAGTMGNITNAGIISSAGTATSFFAGAGICNSGDSKQMGSITNTGVIYGTSNAIKKSDGTIDSSSNYGILVNGDDNNSVVGGLKIVDETPTNDQILNKGLIFKAVDGGYKADENEYGKFGKTFDNGAGITIINAKAVGDKANISGTESLELKKGILTTGDSQTINISPEKRYILNGITNTLEVSEGNNELNGSVINAYGTAVVFGDTGDKELTLSGTIVNGGIDGSAAISGSDDTDNGDTLILQSMASNGGTQNTIVNGNINMGAGADTLTIGDGTIINGMICTLSSTQFNYQHFFL